MSWVEVGKDGSHPRLVVASLDQITVALTLTPARVHLPEIELNRTGNGIKQNLAVVATPEVVGELVAEGVVAGGAGLLGHGEGEAALLGAKVGPDIVLLHRI